MLCAGQDSKDKFLNVNNPFSG